MARLILLTDFSEEYAKQLLSGIVRYSQEHTPWVLCKMPLSYRDLHGTKGVLDWALKWEADAIIGQFYPHEEVELFKRNGIIAIAQDFKLRFDSIPNITGDHILGGQMVARYFIQKGFRNFAFYGYRDVVWSEERCEGFREELIRNSLAGNFFEYQNTDFKELWYYESEPLIEWLKHLPKPIAIMACDDNQAHHIAEICQNNNIPIPEEVALMGVDNDESVCYLSSTPISSLNQAVEKGGYEVARMIDQLLEDTELTYKNIYVKPTHITTRQSTDIYSTDDKYISMALKYIHQNIDSTLKVDDISKVVPLSRRLLESRFRNSTGSSIYNYIYNLRIEKFAERLIETEDSIVGIAMDMGFPDSKNIARQFRHIKGCTPSEYRQTHTLKK